VSAHDEQGWGRVSKKTFLDAVKQRGVFLSHEEQQRGLSRFDDGKGGIFYESMSMELGLHRKAFTVMKSTRQQVSRLRSAGLQL